VVGIALNGVFFLNANNKHNVDLFKPTDNKRHPMIFDECLGSTVE